LREPRHLEQLIKSLDQMVLIGVRVGCWLGSE
jgi:hypothetical protein